MGALNSTVLLYVSVLEQFWWKVNAFDGWRTCISSFHHIIYHFVLQDGKLMPLLVRFINTAQYCLEIQFSEHDQLLPMVHVFPVSATWFNILSSKTRHYYMLLYFSMPHHVTHITNGSPGQLTSVSLADPLPKLIHIPPGLRILYMVSM